MEEIDYRFAIGNDGEVVYYEWDFHKEVYHRYLEVNGLSEENAMDAFTGWEELWEGMSDEDIASEQPCPLPEKYTGDIFEELFEIYIDLCAIGVYGYDPEVIFDLVDGQTPAYDDCNGDSHEIPYQRVCKVFASLGYEIHEEKDGTYTTYYIV